MKQLWIDFMPIEIVELECNIFGDFKVGDNACYNASLLSNLVEANEDGKFNKPISIQAASLVEVAAIQIFYRAKNFNNEGVPKIEEADRQAIAEKQIDRFAVVIDNLQKYHILDGLGDDIYDDLHKLRRFRNKIHIQADVGHDAPKDEAKQFTSDFTNKAIGLNWKVLNYLQDNYERPTHIHGCVPPLRLPRLI